MFWELWVRKPEQRPNIYMRNNFGFVYDQTYIFLKNHNIINKVSPQVDFLSSLWRMGWLWEERHWDISLIPLLPNPGEFSIFYLFHSVQSLLSSSSFTFFQISGFFLNKIFQSFQNSQFFFKIVLLIMRFIDWSIDSEDRSFFTLQADKCIYQYIHE